MADRELTPLDPTRFHVRDAGPDDEPALLALHALAYPRAPAPTAARWRWRYLHNPLQRTEVAVVEERGAGLVAVHAGVTLPALLRGEPCHGALDGDVALHPRFATSLAGTRLVVAVARHHMTRWFGGPSLLGWGFPDPAPMRVGLRYLGYEVLRDVLFLVRAVDGPRPPTDPGLDVQPVRAFGPQADALFARCAERGQRTGLVRDGAYLDWRYAAHPDVDYVLLEAREARGGSLVGLAVAREGGWHPSLCSIMELLVPDGDTAVEHSLLAALFDLARSRGSEHLAAWWAGDDGRWLGWQMQHGFHARHTPWQQCYNLRRPGIDRRALAAEWRQTMGDMDFF